MRPCLKTLLVSGLLFIGYFHAIPEQADQATHDQDSTNKTINTPGAPDSEPTKPLSTKKQSGADDEANQAGWCEHLLAPIFNNWATLAVTIWGIYILIDQTKATRKAAEAAQ